MFFLQTEDCWYLFCYEIAGPYYFYFKIPECFSRVIFRNSLWWLLLEVFQQIRPCSKSATKKRIELFQLMLIRCLYKYLRTYFWSLWRSLFLVKLQAFLLNSSGSRFLRVYCRAQNTLKHMLRIISLKSVKFCEWVKNYAEVLSFVWIIIFSNDML